MTMNQLSYKVVNERSIFVFPDTPPKHAQYDEQVDPDVLPLARRPTELSQMLSTIIRLPRHGRAADDRRQQDHQHDHRPRHDAVVQIIEKIIEQNDKPRAEIVVDVEILEVDRDRAEDATA